MARTMLTVGVSGINAVDNPGPGIGVARSLREATDLEVRIVGLAYDAMEPGIYMDWVVDEAYLLPYPSAGHDAYRERLLYIRERTGMDFVIPTLDTEMPFFMTYRRELAELGIETFVPSPEQYRLRGKDRLAELADTLGLALPRTEVVSTAAELEAAVDRIGTPVMVKGLFYKAHQAHTSGEALGEYHKLAAEWGLPIIVQEVVRGDELNVVAVGDGEGRTLGQVAMKKMWITELGKVWTGVTIRHPAMLDATERFMREYRWRGPMELECIVDGDTVHLVEINPRFPAWSYLATGVGVNLPARMVRRALALPKPDGEPGDYEAGQLFVRYTYELVTGMDRFQKMITTGESEGTP
ncbi:MAG: ATP-grasp domain-containing protein [Gemmatimonadota bacterium]